MIAGVDGCKDKWIGVVVGDNGEIEIRGPQRFTDFYHDSALSLIVVDIPIGLPNVGPRSADVEARRFIGVRRSSVFPAPIRAVLNGATWEDACHERTLIEGKKISKQLYGILPKIREVDGEVRRGEGVAVREGHPEVSFTLMNHGVPLPKAKKTMEGRQLRLSLLREQFPDVDAKLAIHSRFHEDIIDAYSLVWTARRIARGVEKCFPENSVVDELGLLMQIAA